MNELRITLLKFGLIALLALSALSTQAADPTSGDPKDRAVAALEENVKTDPHNAELWVHLGFAYRKLEKIDQAQRAFEKAVSLAPGTKDAYFMLGLIYESKHQDPDAEKAWKRYLSLEKDPDRRAVAEKHIHRLSQ